MGELKGSRVFVTGAGGFIGSHLVERLVSMDCKVRAFVKYCKGNDIGLIGFLPQDIRSKIEVCI